MRSILSAKFYHQLWAKGTSRDTSVDEIDDDIDVPAWVAHERALMVSEVNENRARKGLPPVTLEEIARAGHSNR